MAVDVVVVTAERSLEVKFPTMDRWKSRGQRREEKKQDDQRRERVIRKKMQVHGKIDKSRIIGFFQWFWLQRSKSRLAKAAGVEPSGQMRDEKLHVVVAWSTFPSQHAKNTTGSDSEHLWKLWCWKSARRCGAKHISKSKSTKHASFGALLEVEMLRKCTALWREAHFEVKSAKN